MSVGDINLCINDIQWGRAVALLHKMRSVGCHVEREILPQFPVWSLFSLPHISTFPIWRCGTACRPYAISDRVCVSAWLCVCVCVCLRMWACPAVSSMSNALLSPWRGPNDEINQSAIEQPEKQTSDALNVRCCHGNTGCRFSTSLAAVSLRAFFKLFPRKATEGWEGKN